MAWFYIPLLMIVGSVADIANSHSFDFSRRLRLLDPPTDGNVGVKIIENQYFEQKIDNFNPIDTRVWNQRYHINEDYYNESSKNHVFLMLGGEWEATTGWLTSGGWVESAKKYGALLFYLEHRYYGSSQPFEDLSTENLQFLNAHQALEDAANFIQGMNEKYNLSATEAKWIVFGGSYAGTLASWIRHKYPHLVAGAVDSSGPLEAVLDFHQYLQVVREGFATHSESCVSNIKEAFDELDQLVGGCLEDEEIYEELNSIFQLCDSLELSDGNEKDLATLFEVIANDNFAHVVQYNGRYEITIDTICDILTNETDASTSLEKLGKVNSLNLLDSGKNCTSYKYEELVSFHQNTLFGSNSMSRQWLYQTCTEYGFFQTSTQADPIFSSRFNATYFVDICTDVFGNLFQESLISAGIKDTNVRYGGSKAPIGNVVHFHGTLDPWHVLGKLEASDDVEDTVLVVDGVSHCASMYTTYSTEVEELNNAKRETDRLVGLWLGVTSQENGSNFVVIHSSYMLYIVLLMHVLLLLVLKL